MHGLKIFLLATAISVVVTVALFFGSAALVGAPLNDAGKMQTLIGIVALVLGTSGTVAGAIATLRVAGLGLDISERQEKADAAIFLEGRHSKTVEIYSNILVELGSLYAASIVVESQVPQFDIEKFMNHDQQQLKAMPKSLRVEIDYLCDKLDSLAQAIEKLAQDEFSLSCFAQNLLNLPQSWLDDISRQLIDRGLSAMEATVSLANPLEIIALLEICRRRLKAGKLENVFTAMIAARASGGFGLSYDNGSVRSLFFLGNLVFHRMDQSPGEELYIASYGAAIIRDLTFAIPDGGFIRSVLKDRYSYLSVAFPSLKTDFRPQNLISSSLRAAIQQAEQIGKLYFLVKPQKLEKS